MRILVYGLQSSGASLFTYWLAQMEEYIGVIDLYAGEMPPSVQDLGNKDVILKTTVSEMDFEEVCRRFEPDRVIVFVRNPYDNYASLAHKPYKDRAGTLDQKFQAIDALIQGESPGVDLIVSYEDFVEAPESVVSSVKSIGIPADMEHYAFPRSLADIVTYNRQESDVLARTFTMTWDVGNIHKGGGGIELRVRHEKVGDDIRNKVQYLCPHLVALYSSHNKNSQQKS